MNPVIEKEKLCECGGTIQRFANVALLAMRPARWRRPLPGRGLPNGCTAVVVRIPGAGEDVSNVARSGEKLALGRQFTIAFRKFSPRLMQKEKHSGGRTGGRQEYCVCFSVQNPQ